MEAKVISGVPNTGARAWRVLKAYEKAPSSVLISAAREEDLSLWLNAFNSLSGLLEKLPPLDALWGGDRSLRARAMRALYSPEPGKNYFHVASPEVLAEPLMNGLCGARILL